MKLRHSFGVKDFTRDFFARILSPLHGSDKIIIFLGQNNFVPSGFIMNKLDEKP